MTHDDLKRRIAALRHYASTPEARELIRQADLADDRLEQETGCRFGNKATCNNPDCLHSRLASLN